MAGALLKKIFHTVISKEVEVIKLFKHINEEIDKMIAPYKEQFSDQQLEEIKDLMYGTVLFGKQEGFQLGTMYAIKFLAIFIKI